jgi:hypothetical protein
MAQQPILEIRLPGVGETLVQARLTDDGTLELPAEPLRELTGEDVGDAPYLSLASLQAQLGPGVDVVYDPRRALVQIRDPLGRLAASRARFDELRAENISRPREFLLGGPYGSLTTDIGGGSLVEGGWNFGRAALGGAYSTESGYRWDVSVQPLNRVYVTFQDGERFDSRLTVRWAGGPTFVETSYAPATGDFRARAATSLGPWTFYAQDDGGAAITYTGPVQLTLGRTTDGFVTRVAYGRYPSPLSIPYVR